jgi:hypothetical protein
MEAVGRKVQRIHCTWATLVVMEEGRCCPRREVVLKST